MVFAALNPFAAAPFLLASNRGAFVRERSILDNIHFLFYLPERLKRKATDDVDIEQALETQRLKLLRLLARWAVMLGVLSVGPLALPVPRWVRAFFETLVVRAEMATQNLVRVSACLQVTGGAMVTAPQPCACSDQDEVVPSAQDLLRRINALRDRLENLSLVARRLLRVRVIAGAAFDFSAPSHLFAAPERVAMIRADRALPRVERPPDKIAA